MKKNYIEGLNSKNKIINVEETRKDRKIIARKDMHIFKDIAKGTIKL